MAVAMLVRMETDSFFWQLLKKLPETLFALLNQPIEWAANYRFDALEIKKSYRLDGIFIPNRKGMPLYFVEAQFRRDRRIDGDLLELAIVGASADRDEQSECNKELGSHASRFYCRWAGSDLRLFISSARGRRNEQT